MVGICDILIFHVWPRGSHNHSSRVFFAFVKYVMLVCSLRDIVVLQLFWNVYTKKINKLPIQNTGSVLLNVVISSI